MDNAQIDVTNEGGENLLLAMRIAFRERKATHYATVNGTLVFYWYTPGQQIGDVIPLAAPHSVEDCAALASIWLARSAEYGPQPDHDGSNGRGWRVFNEMWGHVFGSWAAIVAVAPRWAMYGK